MTLYETNRAKLQELLPNCRDRALAFHDQYFPIIPFAVGEVFRTQQRENLLFTQGRTLQDITSMYESNVITQAQYRALKALYDAGTNLTGTKVTWTLSSAHTARKAFDILPIITANSNIPQKQRVALAQLDQYGGRFGVRRPAATLSVQDYEHFEVLDVPMPTPDTNILVKMAEIRREKRLADKLASSLPPL